MLRVQNPYDGSLVDERPVDAPSDVEGKIAAVREAQHGWSRRPLQERREVVARGVDLLRREAEAVALDVTRQMGRPLAHSRNEVAGMLDRAEHMIAIAEEALAPEVLPEKAGFVRRIEHVPLGVVLDAAAWNYPLLIPINVIVPALLAGNTVLLKHSKITPLCGDWFERAFREAGVPGLLAHVVADHEGVAQVIRDPRVDHVVFTGSVGGGRAIQQAARERFIDIGLELGGADPAYVAEDADLEFTASNVVDGACYNAGQSCCAVERVYVHRARHAEFVERAEALLRGYRLGDPMDEATTLGPQASRGQLDELQGQVDAAVAAGAALVCGGTTVEGRFFAPTLLTGCTNAMEIVREESFGPVLPVVEVSDDDEALAAMNDSSYGLTASVWTLDDARAERFVRELEAGTVFQNRCDFLDPALPWVGVKDSGRGASLSRWGFASLTRRKAVHRRVDLGV